MLSHRLLFAAIAVGQYVHSLPVHSSYDLDLLGRNLAESSPCLLTRRGEYKCQQSGCNWSTKKLQEWTSHQNTPHTNLQTCGICQKTFLDIKRLNTHKSHSGHHGLQDQNKDEGQTPEQTSKKPASPPEGKKLKRKRPASPQPKERKSSKSQEQPASPEPRTAQSPKEERQRSETPASRPEEAESSKSQEQLAAKRTAQSAFENISMDTVMAKNKELSQPDFKAADDYLRKFRAGLSRG